MKITQCPNCGSEKIKKVQRDWMGETRGQSYTVPNLEFYECPVCGEKLFDSEAMDKIEKHSPAYAKRQLTKKIA